MNVGDDDYECENEGYMVYANTVKIPTGMHVCHQEETSVIIQQFSCQTFSPISL